MGQIKNIKLHIVTDIKMSNPLHGNRFPVSSPFTQENGLTPRALPSRSPLLMRPKGEERSHVHPNLLSLTNQITPFSRLLDVVNRDISIVTKCEELTDLLRSLTCNDLVDVYPELLSQIFGFSGNGGFGLSVYEPLNYPEEFNAVFRFLSTKGGVFTLINKLLGESNAEFHFPFKLLPSGLVEKITGGQVSLWYQKKLVVLNNDPVNGVALCCNALEYYILLFSLFLIHPQTLNQPSEWSAEEDILYIRLLEEYLQFFFPVTHSWNTTNLPSMKAVHTSPHKVQQIGFCQHLAFSISEVENQPISEHSVCATAILFLL